MKNRGSRKIYTALYIAVGLMLVLVIGTFLYSFYEVMQIEAELAAAVDTDRMFLLMALTIALTFIALAIVFADMNRRRLQAESLNNEILTLADIYMSVHKFDLEKDTLTMIRSEDYIESAIKTVRELGIKDNQTTIRLVMDNLTMPISKEAMEEYTDFSTLNERMRDRNLISLDFFGVHGWAKASIMTLERNKVGEIASFLWTVQWIDDEKQEHDRLKYLSSTDQMTGLRNRGSGELKINEFLNQKMPGMFCLMDIDKFKGINDTFGHDVGDSVIIALAEALQASFRDSDVLMRLGGDEFAVYAPGIRSESMGRFVLDRFLIRLENEKPVELGDHPFTVSVGVTLYDGLGEGTFDKIYRCADRACYEAKAEPTSYIVFLEEMD